ncbi:MAG: hypothetical protein H6868_09045 [Rhodospirillales bacterium]|nr:hypothetical protein [Rhodospirillales bacterium]
MNEQKTDKSPVQISFKDIAGGVPPCASDMLGTQTPPPAPDKKVSGHTVMKAVIS